MTTFERDEHEILKGCDIEVLKRRKAELASLMKQLKCEKNGFKRTCIWPEHIPITSLRCGTFPRSEEVSGGNS